jgi:transcriptional regulator with XRE-family HTH domain
MKPQPKLRPKQVDPRDQRIGQNVRKIRMLRLMSQEKLGDALKLTFQQVQKYEKGTNRISGSRLQQIADALSCTINDLFEGVTAKGTVAPFNDPIAALAKNSIGLRMATAFAGLTPKLQHMIVELCEHQKELNAANQLGFFDHTRPGTRREAGALG